MPTVFLTGDTNAAVTALTTALSTTADQMTGAIGDILPIALPVAGTILVVTIGWRLFRNFTRG